MRGERERKRGGGVEERQKDTEKEKSVRDLDMASLWKIEIHEMKQKQKHKK